MLGSGLVLIDVKPQGGRFFSFIFIYMLLLISPPVRVSTESLCRGQNICARVCLQLANPTPLPPPTTTPLQTALNG